ncbi:MAG: hypothetical protein PHR06_11240 [Candidatus Cloacimonetes bacterium]|nr:hypothetical protein [Candidatus Cloacimonadota bacterium]
MFRKLCIIAALMTIVSTVFADLAIIRTEDDFVSKEYYGNNQFITEENNTRTIFDVKTREITMIFLESQTYAKTNLDEYKKAFKDLMVNMLSSQIDSYAAMTGMTKAEVLKTMLGIETDKEDSNVSSKKEGTANYAGFNCDKYMIYSNDKPTVEVVISPDILNKIKKETDFEAAQKMIEELKNVMNEVYMEIAETSIPEEEELQVIHDLSMKGYLIKETLIDDYYQHDQGDDFVLEVSEQKIDSSIFSIPEGFSQISLNEALQFSLSESEEEE